MGDKEFKTLDEQIEILESRGLSIQDKNLAKSFLLKNNYCIALPKILIC